MVWYGNQARLEIITHGYSASQLTAAHLYLKCGLIPLAALGSEKFYRYSTPDHFWLGRTNFSNQIWVGPILATKFGPPGTILGGPPGLFFPGPKFSLHHT